VKNKNTIMDKIARKFAGFVLSHIDPDKFERKLATVAAAAGDKSRRRPTR